MEQGITKTEQAALQRKERSNALIAIVTNPDRLRDMERGLTIKKIITEALPICELKREVPFHEIALALDIQLTRLVASLNLKWNLNDEQVKTIVEDLIDKYPNESLEDFILVFKLARTGHFKDDNGNGAIYRLDSAVIFGWMEQYLSEKYKALEDKLRAEKDDFKKQYVSEKSDRNIFEEFMKLTESRPHGKIAGMSEADIRKYGQVNPAKKTAVTAGYTHFTVGSVQILAGSQEQANYNVEKLIQIGELKLEDVFTK